MREREIVIAALWAKLAAVTGVQRTARNPSRPPNVEDLPCIHFFELMDVATSRSLKGTPVVPAYKRELSVIIEAFVEASTEAAATNELADFVLDLKRSLYSSGVSLGVRNVEFWEDKASAILRPPKTDKVAGVGLYLKIRYIEDISKL